MRRPALRSLAGGVAGLTAGMVGGLALTGISTGTPTAPAPAARAVIDGAHVPPVLTAPGEPVRLRFAIVCGPREDGRPCDGSGEVYARPGQDGAFRRFDLQVGADSKDGRYFVDLPPELSVSPEGFSYYAVLRGGESTLTIPAGGPAAPHRSFPLKQAATVDLGAHLFGHVRRPDVRVVEAAWGSGSNQVGLVGTRALGFTGPSSFDIGADGTITLLDQVNQRVQRRRNGRPTNVPADVSGGIADMRVDADGSIHVLEPALRETEPVLRTFNSNGTLTAVRRLADRTWSHLALGPSGPQVQQQPSEQWFAASERAHGNPGRTIAAGKQLVVARVGESELRIAELAGHTIARAWRVVSGTPLGEVQLAEPVGSKIVAVVKVYIDDRAEFIVLLLDRVGASHFAVDASAWAETAPLARFRLSNTALYRLSSKPAGVFVDRFDLEVTP